MPDDPQTPPQTDGWQRQTPMGMWVISTAVRILELRLHPAKPTKEQADAYIGAVIDPIRGNRDPQSVAPYKIQHAIVKKMSSDLLAELKRRAREAGE